ncbi:MAG: penicillin-binding protein activator [Desulfotignum sp.]|nr:penicillin-binding protein activator [Desulfotignum sp.]
MMFRHLLILRTTAWIMAVFFLAAIWGCAPKPVRKPADDTLESQTQGPDLTDKEQQTFALVKTLTTQAQKFMDQGDLKNAFLAYNKALAKAPEDPGNQIIPGIEQVLTRTEPSLIKTFLDIRDLAVPRAMLVYWLGVSYAQQEKYPDALAVLTRFMDTWPGHPLAPDAKELMDLIKKTTFKSDTIGCLLPMSGKYAIYGQKALKSIQMAVHDLSYAHGRKFNIIVKDTRGDPRRAAECVDELNKDRVAGIVGPLLTVETAGARAQELEIPLIALTQKTDFPLSGDYLFSNFITPEMQVQTLAAFVFRKLGLRKVAILFPDEPYGRRYMQLFSDAVDDYGGQLVGAEPYDGTGTDFATPIRKLTGAFYQKSDSQETDKITIDFQALFIPDSTSRINMILPHLAFNDARGMVLLGTNLWHQQNLLAETKGYNQNAVITDGYFGKSRKPATAGFEKAFTALYGESPGYLEAIFYDTVQILFLTAMDPSVDSRQRLRDALMEGRMFEGVTGNTIFDETGAARKELFLITVKNNRFKEIRPGDFFFPPYSRK